MSGHLPIEALRATVAPRSMGRCEAITEWCYSRQCTRTATSTRNGHKVCWQHAKTFAVVYATPRSLRA